MGDQHRLAEARGDRRGGVADMDHERSPGGRTRRAVPGIPTAVPATRFGVRMRQCATVTGASLASAPTSKMLCRRRGKGVSGRRAGNNLPLGRVGLIHLLLLEKNRPDSRNGCGSREMRLD